MPIEAIARRTDLADLDYKVGQELRDIWGISWVVQKVERDGDTVRLLCWLQPPLKSREDQSTSLPAR